MFCIELGLIGNSQVEVEYYARGGGLFDEDQHPRDEGGLFAKKGGGAAIADESFALGQAKPGKSKGGRHETQGSLFDTDLHGAEARDLPGQTNFLGDEREDTPATSGIDKSDAPSAKPLSDGQKEAVIRIAKREAERGITGPISAEEAATESNPYKTGTESHSVFHGAYVAHSKQFFRGGELSKAG